MIVDSKRSLPVFGMMRNQRASGASGSYENTEGMIESCLDACSRSLVKVLPWEESARRIAFGPFANICPARGVASE